MKAFIYSFFILFSAQVYAQYDVCSPLRSDAGCNQGQSIGNTCGYFSEGICTSTGERDRYGFFGCDCKREKNIEPRFRCDTYPNKAVVDIYDIPGEPTKGGLVIHELGSEMIIADSRGSFGSRFPKYFSTKYQSKEISIMVRAGLQLCNYNGYPDACKTGTLTIDGQETRFSCPIPE